MACRLAPVLRYRASDASLRALNEDGPFPYVNVMRYFILLGVITFSAASAYAQPEIPKAADPRLVVELVASSPDIVHPISCDFDHQGRLLIIESHTHFSPKDYKGPKFDRIRAFDVKTGKPTTFFEGTRHTMDLAVHPDGSVYIATRNEILRLRDTKGIGVADEKTRIVFLDTKGDYPHNGLSGLCFDSKGDLLFGMGENLGAKYTLIGSDGVKFSGDGDGGHIFHATADGKKLHRVATGFWNPFGICRDIYGRTFAVDNDPDQAPPCRMLHVVEGGDYGFRFCYGRSGKHPFQSWHGTLPGTLPMMTGVGEAPCEILSYESDGLPAEYRGQLLVTSWADHRVERYAVKPHGASFKGERLPFVQGGNNFRPTGMCIAPDGSLFVADWVKSDYTLHGKGAIWHIRWKDAPKVARPSDPKKAIFSMHRPLREAAAKKLVSDENGREFVYKQLKHENVRVRATALTLLTDLDEPFFVERLDIADSDVELGMRELAVKGIGNNHARRWLKSPCQDSVRAEAARYLNKANDATYLLELLSNGDPFLHSAAVQQMQRHTESRLAVDQANLRGPGHRLGLLLAEKQSRLPNLNRFLEDPDETVRFLAVKWIADEKLTDYRDNVVKAMKDPKLSVRMYMAYATALARLDGQEVNERSLADYFAQRLADDTTLAAQRAMLLRQVPATHAKLTVELLTKLSKSDDPTLKLEAVRALVEHPSPKRIEPLLDVVRNPKLGVSVRAHALLGLTDRPALVDELITLVRDKEISVQHEAMRALIGIKLSEKQLLQITAPVDLTQRVAGDPFFKDRPAPKGVDTWLKRLEGPADAEAGARIFFHPKLAGCYKCHRIDGRGQDVGPDLSSIGRTDRRHILESILMPSNTVAPHYVAWHLETTAGKVQSGMLLHTHLDEYTYLDVKGTRFKLKTADLAEQRPTTTSIMPDGLVDRMTDQEVRDLLAYLQARK
ncbi:MAG: c-type cytochrome [Gemmataceae bacterium]|nr:c-type cytochrome [Gemmataceae bacterium]